MEPTETIQKTNLMVPIAIVVAGAIIAGALYFTKGTTAPKENVANNEPTTADVAPVTPNDHIFGNPDAPIVIVEYSDTECPFCKTFHTTMNQIMNEYGKDGKVAWVYRHFPLDQIHSKADKEAEATECATEQGGNEMFWKYINRIFEVTPSNNNLDSAQLPKIAEELGLDKAKFESCLSSGAFAAKVEEQFQSGIAAGVRGTPNSFIITKKDGKTYSLEGAQPYTTVKSVIEAGLIDAERGN
ncbi:MAG: thioredoxin domain-containing protein [Patescibacteria group bacterium]